MEMGLLWSATLTAGMGVIGWILKSYADEVKRLSILLNRTREEIARDCITKGEVHHDIDRVISRLDAMDAKIDRIMERGK